ncbi:tetratricopeptide repeat protein [Nocardioides sp. TF02-7]|uniref:tetratricopeptide repeat protein n=1 Tax=Nocardioides sp. TF02-7 TaxID=2917724 RepID=UPI001F06896C|nr:tetratricopeptide repeat protein [Nocardioides sp. TF02-7]UMG94977.1 tetratricopeptide repeat protein [Nocardioides sp. TF02-7]
MNVGLPIAYSSATTAPGRAHTGRVHPAEIWDFDDPAGSEHRFRRAAADRRGAERAVLLTQAARAAGLQERYDNAHALLDEVAAADGADDPEVAVRLLLERGRLRRSAGDPAAARPLFEEAAVAAARAGLEELHVDALHMVALAAAPEERRALTERALAVARAASDPRARDWDASLLNNLAMTWADAGDFAAALAGFEEALAARRRIGDPGATRVARWMVAWALRNLGRAEEARARSSGR